MPGSTLLTRVARHYVKTVTFTGASGAGATGTVAIATVTGRIRILRGSAFCSTLLASSGGTIELGTASNTAAIIAQSTATEIDANEFWTDTTPEAQVSAAFGNLNVSSSIILTIGTADVTAGVIEFSFHWEPVSLNGNLS